MRLQSLSYNSKIVSLGRLLRRSYITKKKIQKQPNGAGGSLKVGFNNEKNKTRVSKLLACSGACSRREAEILIANRQVLVNGEIIAEQGSKASNLDTLEITAEGLSWLKRKVTLVLNKPRDYESYASPSSQDSVLSLICEENRHKILTTNREKSWSCEDVQLLNIAGRLDKESRGLLILTQDGALARKLVGKNCPPKRYLVVVDQDIHAGHLVLLRGQLYLDDNVLSPMLVSYINSRTLSFIIEEGRNRQIRRCCAMVGLRVLDLCRTSIGALELGNLPEGSWRQVTAPEVLNLK